MRAVVIHAYGNEDVLQIEERPVPEPAAGQVRVKVAGAAVNQTDLNLRTGLYPMPEPGAQGYTFGMDVSGVVDALGADAVGLQVGDAVIGFAGPPETPAAQAELVVLPAAAATRAPSTVALTRAASLPLNGLTALQALALADLARGATVVVTGAAGGLGTLLVQLAQQAGHRVVAWVRPGTDTDELRGLGADEVITRRDETAPAVADAVFDAATLGQETIGLLADGGAYVTFRGNTPTPERGTRQIHVSVHNDPQQLQQLVQSVDSGTLRLSEVTELPLEHVAEAQRRFAAGGLRERLVLVP